MNESFERSLRLDAVPRGVVGSVSSGSDLDDAGSNAGSFVR